MNAYAKVAAVVSVVVLGFGVVQAATVSRSGPTGPTLEAFLEREVAVPLRERHLGWDSFSRAGPRWDAKQLRVVVVTDRPDAAGFTAFRIEAPSRFRQGVTETVWLGRVDASRRVVELSPGRVPAAEPRWQPLADVLKLHLGG